MGQKAYAGGRAFTAILYDLHRMPGSMGGFYFRWLLLLAALALLVLSLSSISWWSVAGFLICGGVWYWLSRRKALALDSPRPKI